jgi:hypothetical protein
VQTSLSLCEGDAGLIMRGRVEALFHNTLVNNILQQKLYKECVMNFVLCGQRKVNIQANIGVYQFL